MGDFIYPDIDWADRIAHSFRDHHFLNVLLDNFMCKLVYAPTRKNALLDLLITNNTDLTADMEIRDNLGNSDPRVVTFRENHIKRWQKGSARTLSRGEPISGVPHRGDLH